jgi:hypothetical protein
MTQNFQQFSAVVEDVIRSCLNGWKARTRADQALAKVFAEL